MGNICMVIGESGTGKSCSLRNFEKGEIGIFNIANKPLPFRKKLDVANNVNYEKIYKTLKNPKICRYVIDDSQYLMAFEMFDRAKEVGYGKFTDVALNFRNLLQFIITQTPENIIVYFLHHSEQTDLGRIKAKTSGKMLDNQLTLEGLFSIVLQAKTDGKRYWFETQSDGNSTCKSPMGMFEREIDNDLKFVDKTIRDYWGLTQAIEIKNTKDEVKKDETI